MQKVNVRKIIPVERRSPEGKYGRSMVQLSVGLGREEGSTDALRQHPFDVAIITLAPGKSLCPYHSHSAQWEFYHVLSGVGTVRHEGGTSAVAPGDAFLFKPGEAHQLTNAGAEDFVVYVVADNPVGESCHYPDSGKWLVRSPARRLIRSEDLDYFDGEE